jgi:hypothetical protein
MTTRDTGPLHIWREQGLSATVHRACRICGAPGVWSSDPSIKRGWRGCYVEPGSAIERQAVGPECPNCLADRNPSLWTNLGEIWRKVFVAEPKGT